MRKKLVNYSASIKASIVFVLLFATTLMWTSQKEVVLAAGEAEVQAPTEMKTITIAQKKKKKKKKRSSEGRQRILSSEKSFKSQKGASKTNLDFDEVDISGQRKTPLGSMVGSTRDKKGFNFIEVRREWHNEMVQSASRLD